jgi:steroid delta-isomerase-like uncharacterized protein
MHRVFIVLSAIGLLAGTPAVSHAQDSTEANKDLVRQAYAAYNAGDIDALDAIVAADAVDHDPVPGQAAGLEGIKQSLQSFRDAFTGDVVIDDLVAQGDMVADRTHIDGRHTGALFGIPPTNADVHIETIDMWRIEDGQIVEAWHIENVLQLLIQIGAVPSPGGGSAATPMSMSMPAMAPSPATPAAGGADVAANVELIRGYYAAVNAGNLDAFDELIAADAVDHNPSVAGLSPGREGIRQAITALHAAFPDYQVTTEVIFGESDLVAVRSTATGTQDGPLATIPPTGKPVQFDTMDIWRIQDGQIVEVWHIEELLDVLIQVGAVPPPGGSATPAP